MKNKLFTCLGAFLLGVLLTGCGGGGGGSGSAPGAGGTSGFTEKARQLATNPPKKGSVTQTSDGGPSSALDVTLFFNADNEFGFTLTYEKSGQRVVLEREDYDKEEDFEADINLDNHIVNFYHDLPSTVTTQAELDGHTNWLAGGLWIYFPPDADPNDYDNGDIEIAVFVDGGDPFHQSNIARLTGTASYTGVANGFFELYNRREDDYANHLFSAVTRLTATFGSDRALGSIEGDISDLYDVTEDEEIPNFVIHLGTANIRDEEGGFFIGDTSVDDYPLGDSGGTVSFAGKWGGQFFGNGAPTDHPSKVGGTFGGACSNCPDGYQINFAGIFAGFEE